VRLAEKRYNLALDATAKSGSNMISKMWNGNSKNIGHASDLMGKIIAASSKDGIPNMKMLESLTKATGLPFDADALRAGMSEGGMTPESIAKAELEIKRVQAEASAATAGAAVKNARTTAEKAAVEISGMKDAQKAESKRMDVAKSIIGSYLSSGQMTVDDLSRDLPELKATLNVLGMKDDDPRSASAVGDLQLAAQVKDGTVTLTPEQEQAFQRRYGYVPVLRPK
jgi:hypothetical protein